MSYLRVIFVILVITSVSLQSGARDFTDFQYLTKYESTVFGEPIKFWGADTLYGWVHSNDQIAIMQNPVFFGPITTSDSCFQYQGGANPSFAYPPIFNYPQADFPEEFSDLREAAYQQGYFFEDLGFGRKYILKFKGTQGYELYYRWQEVPVDTYITTLAPIFGGAVFFDDTLEMTGTDTIAQIDYGVFGQLSIGASGDIWLGGNIRYINADLLDGSFSWENEQNNLGILSESNILIRNNWENGRDNGAQFTNVWRKDIIIDASLFALGESFSFEDHNDDSSAGGGLLPEWYYSNRTTPDERGNIYLWGSLTQSRRGYVHRSNHGGTGYGKNYHYPENAYIDPPPFFPIIPAELTFSSDTLYFGEVAIGEMASLPLEIYNFCMDSLNVLNCSYTNPAFSGNYPGTSLICPADSIAMTISFHPSAAISYNSCLIILTNDGPFVVCLSGTGVDLGVDDDDQSLSADHYKLYPAYPNPFNQETNISYSLPKSSNVRLMVFDVNGVEVARIVEEWQSAGTYSVNFKGGGLSSGVYFARLTAGDFNETCKLLLIK